MPSVGMRRTTRVFGVVKGGDTACVLRSGRRLWPDFGDGKTRRGDEWEKNPNAKPKQGTAKATLDDDNDDDNVVLLEMVKQRNRKARSLSEPKNGRDRFFGIVYSRKRKRSGAGAGGDGKMFGSQFYRRQWRKDQFVLAVVVKPCSGGGDIGLFSCFLSLVLRHVTRFGLKLKDLSAFLLSQPISAAYASRGIHFFQGSVPAKVGICQFFGITQFMPLFCVDFSAVPLCFKHLHSAVLLRYMFRSFFLVYNPVNVPSDVEEEIDLPDFHIELRISCSSFKREASETGTITFTPEVIEINDGSSLQAPVKCSGPADRNVQYQKTDSKCIQRKGTSLRKRKARNPSTKKRRNGALAPGSKDGRKISIAGVSSNKKLRVLANSCTSVSLSEGKYSSYCSANILVAESDRCYRVEGAVVTSEQMPESREWLLAVKKDGLTRCTFKAERVMRPCSSNRYTHMRMVSLENGWKLEFANHQDWIVFKNLYKECSGCNVPAPVPKSIPVPGVRDVSDYADTYSVPFNRSDTYIYATGDEFCRAMTRRTANYDMDSEDEEWLSKFNNEFQGHVSEDNFELIVDALEKAYYYNPDDCCDKKSVANWCQDLFGKKVVEAVHSYWMRKRKQKGSSLLRVFQSYQSKRYLLIPMPLRKKRSFRRQPSQLDRSKLPSYLQEFVADLEALEVKRIMAKIEAAKESAKESKKLAVQRRKRARSLLENANLAIYKASILLKMAAAAKAGASVAVHGLAEHLLD